VSLSNFWSGEWQSQWVLKDGVLSGTNKVRSHYFEMGNLQVNLDKTYDSIPCKDASNAKEVVAAIKNAEDKVSWNFNTHKGLIWKWLLI